MQPTTTTDETTRPPETVGHRDTPVSEPQQLGPEAEEGDPEEAGYGYGV